MQQQRAPINHGSIFMRSLFLRVIRHGIDVSMRFYGLISG